MSGVNDLSTRVLTPVEAVSTTTQGPARWHFVCILALVKNVALVCEHLFVWPSAQDASRLVCGRFASYGKLRICPQTSYYLRLP